MIPTLFSPDELPKDSGVVLTSAVYFKGTWLSPFTPSSTKPEDFTVGPRKKPAPMMKRTGYYGYARVGNVQVAQLPYKSSQLAFEVFLPDDPAGLSGLSAATRQTRAAIGQVVQEARVQVDEQGTVAAAATGVMILATLGIVSDQPPLPFHVDHPFLFLIRDTATGRVLFIGRVVDPG